MEKVFVYGSLKEGYYNHRVLGQSEFIGKDEAEGVLYAGAHFPMAIPSHDANKHLLWIKGEVYNVDEDTLARLDRLEGHPNFYKREEVQLKSGVKAFMYFFQHPVHHLKFLPEGEWKG